MDPPDSYPEDDLNQSYEFDYQEDQRARAADIEEGGEPAPAKKKKKKVKKAARDKKREIEAMYGSHATIHNSSGKVSRGNRSDQGRDMTFSTMTMSSSDNSIDFEDLEKVPSKRKKGKKIGSHHSADNLDLGFDHRLNSSTGKIKRKKKMQQKLNRSLDLDDYFLDDEDGSNQRGNQLSSKNSRASHDSFPARRVVKMRNTDRLLQPRGGGFERQDSGLSGGNSVGSRPKLQRGNSGRPAMTKGNSKKNMQRQPSGKGNFERNGLPRQPSANKLARQQSEKKMRRQASGKNVLERQPSAPRRGMQRAKSQGNVQDRGRPDSRPPETRTGFFQRSRSVSMDRSRSRNGAPPMKRSRSQSVGRNGGLARTQSNRSMRSQKSSRSVGSRGGRQMDRQQSQAERAYYNKYLRRRAIPMVEETPPKSLVLIWIVVFAELAFDLGSTVIAFNALLEEDECCGEQMKLGIIPMTVNVPFLLLIVAELVFLFRAIILTLWPSIWTGEVSEKDREIREGRGGILRSLCCCLRWNAKAILEILNFLVLLNPFFGCIVAWILLYQSDKMESFIVLGLEGGSILLHFFSVYLEGSCNTAGQFFCHCIPLVPFFVSVSLILLYLKQGGVCYVVEEGLFKFTGCEMCPTNSSTGYPHFLPPIDGNCTINGTSVAVGGGGLFDFEQTIGDLDGIVDEALRRTHQNSFCGNEAENVEPGSPEADIKVCWFDFNGD